MGISQTFKRIWHWLTYPSILVAQRDEAVRKQELFETAYFRTLEQLKARHENVKALEAQLVQLRVSQSAEGRAGWEVMCFIPEEVLDSLLCRGDWNHLIKKVTIRLVDHALRGIHRVRAHGRVTALVFAPVSLRSPANEPRMVEAIFDKEGKFKTSQHVWDEQDEEARVRRAAGCGGYGV